MAESLVAGLKQFDVFANPVPSMAGAAPYIVVLSSNLIDLPAILVAPLLLNPAQIIRGVDVPVVFRRQALTAALLIMAAVAPDRLRRPLGSLLDQEDEIRRGLDRLFTGF